MPDFIEQFRYNVTHSKIKDMTNASEGLTSTKAERLVLVVALKLPMAGTHAKPGHQLLPEEKQKDLITWYSPSISTPAHPTDTDKH